VNLNQLDVCSTEGNIDMTLNLKSSRNGKAVYSRSCNLLFLPLVLSLCLLPINSHSSPDTGKQAEPEISSALDSISLLDFANAASKLDTILKSSGAGTPEWEKASLSKAVCLHCQQPDRESDKAEAARLYDQIIEKKSGSISYQLALLFRGNLADRVDYLGDKPDPEKALKCYDTLLSGFPNSSLAPYAVLYRAEAKCFTDPKKDCAAAIAELESWLKQHPDNSLASLQWYFIADIRYYPLGDCKGATTAMLQSEKAGLPPAILRDEFWWKLANLAAMGGDKVLAETYLNKILNLEFSRLKTASKNMLAEMKADNGGAR
jgi:tetratricopeptide (TPR) repeat protein